MKIFILLIFAFFTTATPSFSQDFQYKNYTDKELLLPESWQDLISEFPFYSFENSALLNNKAQLKKGLLINDTKILTKFDQIEIISCQHGSLVGKEIFQDPILGDRIEEHLVWANRLNYSPHFTTTLIYIEHTGNDLYDKHNKVILLNTKNNKVISIAKVASSGYDIESTILAKNNIFKFRISPDFQDNIILDKDFKELKAKGHLKDMSILTVWFKLDEQGYVKIIRKEEI